MSEVTWDTLSNESESKVQATDATAMLPTVNAVTAGLSGGMPNAWNAADPSVLEDVEAGVSAVVEAVQTEVMATATATISSAAETAAIAVETQALSALSSGTLTELPTCEPSVNLAAVAVNEDFTALGSQDVVLPPNIDAKDLTRLKEIDVKNGSYGKVYLYKWKAQQVAVKMFNMEIKLQIRECNIHWSLKHKNIIELHGVSYLPELSIVMELAEGGTLLKAIMNHGQKITHEVTVNWAAQIADGLNYLHDNRCVHRDLHPGNVLLMEPLQPSSDFHNVTLKISDFGLARANVLRTVPTTRKSYAIMYQAPEVYAKCDPKFSPKSDVYSYGAVVLTIEEKDTPTIGYPVKIPEYIPIKLKILITSCLKPNRADRPDIRKVVQYLKDAAVYPHDLDIANRKHRGNSSSNDPSENSQKLDQGATTSATTADHSLTENFRRAYSNTRNKLTDQEVNYIAGELYSYTPQCILQEEMEEICDTRGATKKATTLLNIIAKKNLQVIQVFEKKLRQMNRTDLADLLASSTNADC